MMPMLTQRNTAGGSPISNLCFIRDELRRIKTRQLDSLEKQNDETVLV